MQEKELQEVLTRVPFRFAKSMPQCPHHYTLREKWNDNASFNAAVMLIREIGTPRKFGNREYIYYDFGGNTYWTMGDPVNKTILINRAEMTA